MNELVTVYVVDDDQSVRKALDRLISSVGFSVVTFASSREFLDLAVDGGLHGPCCAIFDIRMPGLSGLDLQQELPKRRCYTPPIIFITEYGDIPMAVRAMKNGAVEFLTKPFNDQQLLDAVNMAVEIDRNSKSERELVVSMQARSDRLTPRERQVMALVISGMLNKQIAYELEISEKTVKVHRGHVMDKLEVSSVADMVRMAQKVGITPGDISKSS